VFPVQPEGAHDALSLDVHLAPRGGQEVLELVQDDLGVRTQVDLHRLPVGLHARGRVHRVPEQTVARHLQADHACHTGARVDADPDLQLVARLMLHL